MCMIRKILILVWWWPYLDVTRMSKMMIRVMRVDVMRGIGGSGLLWICVIVVNGKDRDHLLAAVYCRISIPLDVMRVVLRVQCFVAFFVMRILLVVEKGKLRCLARWPCVGRWRDVDRWHFVRLVISIHQNRLSMENLVVGTIGGRWILEFRLNWQNFRSRWVRSVGCEDAVVGRRWSIVVGRTLRSFVVLRVWMLSYLVKNIT